MKYYFGDNREYGAEDIKKALGTFVASGGIAMNLSDGEAYDISALNSVIGSAVASGVTGDGNKSLKLTEENGKYYVSAGKGIFSDGGIVEIEDNTEVGVAEGQYLYIAYSPVIDDVYFLASEQQQTEEAGTLLIPIAHVGVDGKIEDMRRYAEGKVPAAASLRWNVLHEEVFSVDTSSLTGSGYVEAEHEIDGNINFMLYKNETGSRVSTLEIGEKPAYCSIYCAGSKNYGTFNDSFGVGGMAAGNIRAVLLDKKPGRIRMRYYFPSKYNKNNCTYIYKALVGIKA